MNAPVVDLADKFVEVVNDATLSEPLGAERDYLPKFDLTQLGTLKTTVVPRQDETLDRFNRKTWEHELVIDIALQKKWATLAKSEMDTLVALAEELCEWCKANAVQLPTRPEKLIRATVQTLWNPDLLRESKVFTSIVRLTYADNR